MKKSNMRNLKSYLFVLMTIFCVSSLCSSCGDDEEEGNESGRLEDKDKDVQDLYIEYTDAQIFYDDYKSYSGEKFLINTSEYTGGNLLYKSESMPISHNILEIDDSNKEDEQWCQTLKKMSNNSTNVCLFFYGETSSEYVKKVATLASSVGFEKDKIRIYTKGDEDLMQIWEDDPIGPFVEYTEAKTFFETYISYSGAKALIDTREKSKFDAGHLYGAVNLPADNDNTANNNAQWCQDLLASFPTNTCLFFYGTTSFQMTKAVAGRASSLGYGKVNSRIFSKGYDELKSIWK